MKAAPAKKPVWPPDYVEEIARRSKMLIAMKDPEKRRAAMEFYKTHPVEWINDHCVTFDPRKKAPEKKLMPFVLFPRQVEFVHFLYECYNDGEGGLVEKARDIGASWLCCAFSVWLWLFHEGATIGWGSRKEEYVDRKGDPKTIFHKIRQIIDNLPKWMKPDGYDPRMHATYKKVLNPANGSSITGEAGDGIGRGGRTSIYFKDESAHYERPELIEASLGDNTDVQIDISSVNGTANVFYKRRKAGEVWERGKVIPTGKTRVFIFDWRDHPLKTQAWYDRRKAHSESEGLGHLFAQEVDRDYSGAVQGVIIPQKYVKAAIDAHAILGFDAVGEKVGMLDVADEGGDKNALVTRHGVVLQFADHWAEGDTGETTRRAVMECESLGVRDLYYDCIGVGSGVKAESNRLREMEARKYVRLHPWDASAAPLDAEDPIIAHDIKSPLNKDVYKNLKSQSWWRLRVRFEKTYKCVKAGKLLYPVEDLISLPSDLPNLHELCAEMSQPVKIMNSAGQMLVDKKPNGATSPNLADAVVGVYNPSREFSILDAL